MPLIYPFFAYYLIRLSNVQTINEFLDLFNIQTFIHIYFYDCERPNDITKNYELVTNRMNV